MARMKFLTVARKIRSPLRHKEMMQQKKQKQMMMKKQKQMMMVMMMMKEEMWLWWIQCPAEMHTSDPDIDLEILHQTLVASAEDLMMKKGERDD